MEIKIVTNENVAAFQIVAPELGLSLSETGKPLELIRRKGSLKIISNTEKPRFTIRKAHLFRRLLSMDASRYRFCPRRDPAI